MQFLLYSKTTGLPVKRSVRRIEAGEVNEIRQVFQTNGTVCLVGRSLYEQIETVLSQCDFIHCGLKKSRIELFRALKMDRKKLPNPRRIIINGITPGAFKRSLTPFIRNRYQSTDPACLIIVPDPVYQELLNQREAKPAARTVISHWSSGDPLERLLEEAEQHKEYEELSGAFLGTSIDARLIRAFILRAAQTVSPVLILGETGTGKDMIARRIYHHSVKNKLVFNVVNCSAFPDTLFESEVFGYKKGAFTDAKQDKDGLFMASQHGTIFLDEIGDLSLKNQAKILHAIETNEVRPVGAISSVEVKVRIIAATNRNIDAMVMNGTFREDLHYRLNTFRIYTTPLRNHPEDIAPIANALWFKINPGRRLTESFLRYLLNYPWPGNVRELKTILTNINDLFGDVSPTPEHILSIRKLRNDALVQAQKTDQPGYFRMLEMQSLMRITNVTAILSAIKKEVTDRINTKQSRMVKKEMARLELFLKEQAAVLEALCREPLYFRNIELADNLTRYYGLLSEIIKKSPLDLKMIRSVWQSDLRQIDHEISTQAIGIIWGKADA